MKYVVLLCSLLPFGTTFGLPVTQLCAQNEGEFTFLVMDQSGDPLPAVAVSHQGFFLGQTNLDGLIALNTEPGDTLHFNLLGYGQQFHRVSKSPDQRVTLVTDATMIETIQVVGRRNEDPRELPYRVETISEGSIELLQTRTPADALEALSGVYVQKSQFGGGSPVVRGFEANRVLLVVDGVRMNNAIFRNGHLQNAITVDVNALRQMEVIYGPGSLAYGSDALGGVIHFRTQQPSFSTKAKWKVNAGINYNTAANGKSLSTALSYGSEHLATYTQLSWNDFGDLRAGANRRSDFPEFGLRNVYAARIDGRDSMVQNMEPNVQVGSGYRQLDLLHKVRWQVGRDLELQTNLQFSTSSDVPRYDNLSDIRDGQLRWAEWFYGPQNRILGSIRLNSSRSSQFFDGYSLILSHQFIEEDRYNRRFGNPLREASEVDVNSSNLQLDFKRYFTSKRKLNYGLDARHDQVNSQAFLRDVDTGEKLPETIPARYPSNGSVLSTAGLYFDYQHDIGTYWTAQAGARLNYQWMTATFGANDPVEWPATYLAGITNKAGAVTTAASIRYLKAGQQIRLLFAQGFRAPNVDDFAKFRERNGFIQVPNPNLDNERSNSLEIGYLLEKNGWQFELAAYHNWLRQAIVRDVFQLPDGRTTFVSFGDTLSVQANVNADRARIYGLDAGLRKKFAKHWRFTSELHWLRGRRKQRAPDGQLLTLPQDHIPPLYGNLSLGYQSERLEVVLRYRFQAAKAVEDYAVGAITNGQEGLIFDRQGTADNLELTPVDPVTGAYTGSYAWSTLHLHSSLKVGQHLQFTLGVENIFDLHYRTFASGISAPGRNFLFGVSYR